ncbi:2196_t:CDS:2, partial [Acaulospora colombiana]
NPQNSRVVHAAQQLAVQNAIQRQFQLRFGGLRAAARERQRPAILKRDAGGDISEKMGLAFYSFMSRAASEGVVASAVGRRTDVLPFSQPRRDTQTLRRSGDGARAAMSGGYYQLSRTNSEDGDKFEGLDERGSALVTIPTSPYYRSEDYQEIPTRLLHQYYESAVTVRQQDDIPKTGSYSSAPSSPASSSALQSMEHTETRLIHFITNSSRWRHLALPVSQTNPRRRAMYSGALLPGKTEPSIIASLKRRHPLHRRVLGRLLHEWNTLKALAHEQAVDSLGEEDEGTDDDGDDAQEEEANAHLYRDHDELKHSLRSVLQNFRESTRKFIILTSDFEFPVSYSPLKYLLGLDKRSTVPQQDVPAKQRRRKRSFDSAEQPNEEMEEDLEEDEEPFGFARLGLLPQWLRFDDTSRDHREGAQAPGQWRDGDVQLEVVHHAEVYDEYDDTVFNSNSIESQLGNLGGNNAFHFGLVFRLIAYPFNLVNPFHYPGGSPTGEWRPMEFTNWLISERFGYRRRPYTMHQVKVLQGGLMREMWETWREQEAINRDHKFRGLGGLNEVLPDEEKDNDVDPLHYPPKPQPSEEEDDDVVGTTEQLKRMIKRHSEEREEPVANTTVPSEEQQTRRKQGGIVDEDEQDTGPGPMINNKGLVDDGDAHVMFLFTHFVIERSREAMLWSWIVATLGGDRDEFGINQRNQAWKTLVEDSHSELRNRGVIEVLVERRKTMEPWRVQWALDQQASQDGYAYSYYDQKKGLEWWHGGSTYWPTLYNGDHFYPEPKDRREWTKCTIDWNVCFGSEMSSASEIFKRVAFEKTDVSYIQLLVVLKALVKASGDLGLSALLPPADRVYRTEPENLESQTPPSPIPVGEEDVPPHLPLTSHWKTANFSLPAVFASGYWDKDGTGVSLREWVQRALERYRYVI